MNPYTSSSNIENSESEALSHTSGIQQMFSFSPLDLDSNVNNLHVRNGAFFVQNEDSIIYYNKSLEIDHEFEFDGILTSFVDPKAIHAIVSLRGGKNFYINLKSQKKIEINEHTKITSVCWNQNKSDKESTGNIIFGTEYGSIFELEVTKNKVVKLIELLDLQEETKTQEAITGLAWVNAIDDSEVTLYPFDEFKQKLSYYKLSFIQLAEYYLDHSIKFLSFENIVNKINQEKSLFVDSLDVLLIEIKKRRGEYALTLINENSKNLLRNFWSGRKSLFDVISWIDKELIFNISKEEENDSETEFLRFTDFLDEISSFKLSNLEASIYYRMYKKKNLQIETLKDTIYKDMMIEDDKDEFIDNISERVCDKCVIGSDFNKEFNRFFKIHIEQEVPLCIIASMIFLSIINEYIKPQKISEDKFLVLVSTTNRFYYFVGESVSLKILFDSYKGQLLYIEHSTRSSYNNSQLAVLSSLTIDRSSIDSDAFVWLNNSGVHHGHIDVGRMKSGVIDFQNSELLEYDNSMPDAIGITTSQYHLFVLFPDKLKIYMCPPALNISSRDFRTDGKYRTIPFSEVKLVYEESFPRDSFGRAIGLCVDPHTFELYVYTERQIFRIDIDNEEQDIWRLYASNAFMSDQLNEKYFETALRIVEGKNELKNMLIESKAEILFKKKYYLDSAIEFSKAGTQFEEVVVKLYSVGEKDALHEYLLQKLSNVEKSTNGNAKTLQMRSLCMWLVDLWLSKINRQKCESAIVDKNTSRIEFRNFLTKYHKHLDKESIFKLISSFGFTDELIHYAIITKEYERAIRIFITESHFEKSNQDDSHLEKSRLEEALNILDKKCNFNHAELFYKYTPILIQYIPKKTIKVLREKEDILNAEKLVPAIMRQLVNEEYSNYSQHIVKYLESIVSKKNYSSIHNLLLYLYAKDDHEELLNFVGEDTFYDPKFALRVCMTFKRYAACVKLFSQMGMHTEAVELALLKTNMDFVVDAANKPDNDETKKQLWLKIAKSYISKQPDPREAIKLLDFTDILKIEDILPFFSDNTKIDVFHESLSFSLDRYKSDVEELKNEMKEMIEISLEMKQEIKSFTNRHGIIPSNSTCENCRQPIYSQDFYLFPCNHKFHSKCIENNNKDAGCPLCSSSMISIIHAPFTEDFEQDKIWSISK